MALIVAPAEGYDSYVSVAQADQYHADMGNIGWTGDEPNKESALRRATLYIEARYRLTAGAADPVHRKLLAATSELALRALSGPLQADVPGKPLVVERTIGPLTTKYAAPVNGGQASYPAVDDLLRSLVVGRSAVMMLKRI